MQKYNWPGNIRELENIIERAIIISETECLKIDCPFASNTGFENDRTLEEIERNHILKILNETNWKIAGPGGAANILGLNSNTMRSRMEKLQIEKPRVQHQNHYL